MAKSGRYRDHRDRPPLNNEGADRSNARPFNPYDEREPLSLAKNSPNLPIVVKRFC